MRGAIAALQRIASGENRTGSSLIRPIVRRRTAGWRENVIGTVLFGLSRNFGGLGALGCLQEAIKFSVCGMNRIRHVYKRILDEISQRTLYLNIRG